jgi:hypothetical protein
MWDNFMEIARENKLAGGAVAIELPRSCKYWDWKVVKDGCIELGLRKAKFHGCSMGLVEDHTNLPIMKPWTIATDDVHLYAAMHGRTCPGPSVHPIHAPCTGKNAKKSELYTDEMVSDILSAHENSNMLQRNSNGMAMTPVLSEDTHQTLSWKDK